MSPDDRLAAHEQSPLHILPPPILILLAFACLILAACVAGLTLGLMSLDSVGLEVVMQSNNAREAAAARAIKPVREQGNLLLVTLLFTNTLASELLPLVLEALVPGGYFSLIVSVFSIMLFGEIIPQAVCSRHPLIIGSFMIGFVKVLRFLLYPLSAPIAFMLDLLLGEELGTVYNKEELKGLIDVHMTNEVLTQDETTILKGALEFSQKNVGEIMTPAENVFKLDIDSKLNRDTLLRILRSGHSRVPIYESFPDNIVCLLLVKQLVLVNPDDELPIRCLISKKKRNYKIRVAPALECSVATLTAELLNEFQKGRSHMAMVYDDITKKAEDRKFVGIVSIEDIIEEILQEEIVDETDAFTDNTYRTKVLVRNADGVLVRTTATNPQAVRLPSTESDMEAVSKAILLRNKDGQIVRTLGTSHTVVLPGTSADVVVKQMNVPALREPLLGDNSEQTTRADWKKSRKGGKASLNSSSQSLLRSPHASDLELGLSQAEAASRGTVSERRVASPPRLSRDHVGTPLGSMRYARMPGHSMHSLFGEDDNMVPEDFANSSKNSPPNTVAEAISSNETASTTKQETASASDPRKQLQLRPLPINASSSRTTKLPSRQRTGEPRLIPDIPPAYSDSYGSFDSQACVGGSESKKEEGA